MLDFRGFLAITRWDLVLELRRREAVLNMTLFAVLILFIASYSLQMSAFEFAERYRLTEGDAQAFIREEFGPLILWISILFSGTVGLSRAFAVEKEGGALTGVLISPIDPGSFYLAKALATWIYVMVMELLVLVAYIVLFNFSRWDRLPLLLLSMGLFTISYVAAGTVIAALTHSLRGGEVVLRILLFPIMIPAVIIVTQAGKFVFSPQAPPDALGPGKSLLSLLALGTIYTCIGFVLFPKVVEE
jgi:heme exporter protein B